MIALDTNALSVLLLGGSVVYKRGSNTPIKHAKERIEELIRTLTANGESLLISTPVLSEFLVKVPAERIQDVLLQLKSSAHFRIEAFDTACAVELADRTAKAIAAKDKREGLPADTPWAKVKFDRQIITIAIVNGATQLISNDADLVAIGARWNFPVVGIEDLPLPGSLVPPPLLAHLEEPEV